MSFSSSSSSSLSLRTCVDLSVEGAFQGVLSGLVYGGLLMHHQRKNHQQHIKLTHTTPTPYNMFHRLLSPHVCVSSSVPLFSSPLLLCPLLFGSVLYSYNYTNCSMKQWRQSDDVLNSICAGGSTGLLLSIPHLFVDRHQLTPLTAIKRVGNNVFFLSLLGCTLYSLNNLINPTVQAKRKRE